MSKIEVDAITEQSGSTLTVGGGASKTVVADATTVTLGRCGGTVALASGATQTGFGRTGTVDWDTTPKTATFSAVSGDGFFANTSGGAFTMNLPAGSAGAIVSVADYAGTWQTNNLTVSPNGTDKIGSVSANVILNIEGQSVTFVYVDGTQGWINTMDSTSNVRGASFICASVSGAGNAITTAPCGDYKLATFTGPGNFVVASVSNIPTNNTVDYLVVAGGGGANASVTGGGGGGGGFRYSAATFTSPPCAPAHPLRSPTGLTVTAATFPITVGAGGAGPPSPANGSNSIFSTITSAGGGRASQPGGSGGGTAHRGGAGGSGNTPSVSPPQGNNGGDSPFPTYSSGGGGGAMAAGVPAQLPGSGGNGGPGGAGGGVSNVFGTSGENCGSNYYFSGGGGGGSTGTPVVVTQGGIGGGGDGTPSPTNVGAVNTGGGGGGIAHTGGTSGSGGSGIVIIRYKFQ